MGRRARGGDHGDAVGGVGCLASHKGELSEAVTPDVDERLRTWCPGCEATHVHHGLFRCATLQAGLVLEVGGPTGFRYAAGPSSSGPSTGREDVESARRALVSRFVALAGAARPAALAAWAALSPQGAKRWWALVADDLDEVRVGGRPRAWTSSGTAPKEAPGVVLLPPYDPWTTAADRELVVPDAAQRKQVWRSITNPGVLLLDGEVAGVWRQRTSRRTTELALSPFATLPARRRRAVEDAAAALASPMGVDEVRLGVDSS